eukprot:7094075-Heterocapsa_arctica.AAC.1
MDRRPMSDVEVTAQKKGIGGGVSEADERRRGDGSERGIGGRVEERALTTRCTTSGRWRTR